MLLAWFQSELVPVVVHNSKITRYIITFYSRACWLDCREDDWVLEWFAILRYAASHWYLRPGGDSTLMLCQGCFDHSIILLWPEHFCYSHHRKSVSRTSIRLHDCTFTHVWRVGHERREGSLRSLTPTRDHTLYWYSVGLLLPSGARRQFLA